MTPKRQQKIIKDKIEEYEIRKRQAIADHEKSFFNGVLFAFYEIQSAYGWED